MGNNFLKQLADAGLNELMRMPHALDPTRLPRSFPVHFRGLHRNCTTPITAGWLADVVLPLAGARTVIKNEAREFLLELLEVNSPLVQNDVLQSCSGKPGPLEVEIRKSLDALSPIAEQALGRARKVKERELLAVQFGIERLID